MRCDSGDANKFSPSAGIGLSLFVAELTGVAQATATYESPAYRAALDVLGNAAERDIRIIEGMD